MKKIYTLCVLVFWLCSVSSQQGIPGYFEISVTDMPGNTANRAIVKMRAVSTIVPEISTCDVDDNFATDIVAGFKFALRWPVTSGITNVSVNASNNAPGACPDPGENPLAGYSLGNGTAVLLSSNGTTRVKGLQMSSSLVPIPVDWVLNQWMTICTLTITGGSCTTCEALNIYMMGDFPELEGGNDLDHILAFDETGTGTALEYDASPFNGPLPINLVSFDAEKSGQYDALLTWTTTNEENSSHFQIQRSFDKKAWFEVGSTAAAGFSLEIKNYSFTNFKVYNGKDARLPVYYRLNMVDIDGRSKLSPIRSIIFGNDLAKGAEYLVYPNPAFDGIHIEWDIDKMAQPSELEIYNIDGKLVYSTEVSEKANQHYIDFTYTNIQTGVYVLRFVESGIPIEYRQIVIQR